MDLQQIESPEQLAALLTGLSDAEIGATVAELGPDAVLDRIFGEMARRFDAAKAAGQRATIEWVLTEVPGPDGGGATDRHYTVVVADGACSAEPGDTSGPDITLTTSLPVFLRLVSGGLNGTSAFMNGQLQVGGNIMTAMAMQAWFGI